VTLHEIKRYVKQAVVLKESQTYQASHADQVGQVLGHKFQAFKVRPGA